MQIEKEQIKQSFFINDTVMYVEIPKNQEKNLLNY